MHTGVPDKDAQKRYEVISKSFCSDGGVLMRTWLTPAWALVCRFAKFGAAAAIASLLSAAAALAQTTEEAGGEASLKLPDLRHVQFLAFFRNKLLPFALLFSAFA